MSEKLEMLSHNWAQITSLTYLNHVDITILPAGTAALRALPGTTTSITILATADFTYARPSASTSPPSLVTHTARADEIYQRYSESGRYGYRNLAHDGKGDAVVFTATVREQTTGSATAAGTEAFAINISYQYYRDRIDRDGANTIILRVHCPVRRSFLTGVPTTGATVIAATTYRTYV